MGQDIDVLPCRYRHTPVFRQECRRKLRLQDLGKSMAGVIFCIQYLGTMRPGGRIDILMNTQKYGIVYAFGELNSSPGIPFLHGGYGFSLRRISKLLGFSGHNGIDPEKCTKIPNTKRHREIQGAFHRSIRRYSAAVCAAVAGVYDQHRQALRRLRRCGMSICIRQKHTMHYDTNPEE